MNISSSTAISQKKASSNLDHNRSPFFGVGSNEHFGMSSCVLLSHRTEMASLKDVQVEKNRRTRKDQRFRTSKTHSCKEKRTRQSRVRRVSDVQASSWFQKGAYFYSMRGKLGLIVRKFGKPNQLTILNARYRWNTRIFPVKKISFAVKIRFLSFTCEDIKVTNTSVSANRKSPSLHPIFSDTIFPWIIT